MDRLRSALRLTLLANQYPALHGLRVLAITTVLQAHVTIVLSQHGLMPDSSFARLSLLTYFGMDMFFMMSGFLIGTMILHATAPNATRKHSILRFYVRRAFRTFPLYYVVLTALAVSLPLTATQRSGLIYEYAYLTNYHYHDFRVEPLMSWGWSLCVEEHFYLAVPVLLAALRRVKSHVGVLTVLLSAWISALGVRLLILYEHKGEWLSQDIWSELYVKTHTRYDVLVAGIIIAYVQFHFGARLKTMFERREMRLAFGIFAYAGFFPMMIPRTDTLENPNLWCAFRWGTLSSVTFTALLLLMMNSTGPVQRFLGSPIFLRIATLGYGIYLIHVPIFEYVLVPLARVAIDRHGAPIGLVWPVALLLLAALSAAGSYVLHVVIDKPLLVLRDRLAS